MSEELLRHQTERFLAAALRHPECRGGRIVEISENGARLSLDINVEMPLHFRVDGSSPNGVRRIETVSVLVHPEYPWSAPIFHLRDDFPRDLPHLQPAPLTEPPQPCLIDGNPREYFFQFGLVELGVFNLVHQLVLWLRHAATGALIDPTQGWEPVLRRNLTDIVVLNAESCRAMVDRRGGYRVLQARFFRRGQDDGVIGRDANAVMVVSDEQVPLKRGDAQRFQSRRAENGSCGDTVCCVLWPDKLPNGTDFVMHRYIPETVGSLGELRTRAEELGSGRSFEGFIQLLERFFDGYTLNAALPVAVVFCARRPIHLIGSDSDIELLPYVLDVRAAQNRESLFAGGNDEPVAPAMQVDDTNPALLRNVSGAPTMKPVAMLGCGSVGSKMAMHLAKSGVEIPVVSDVAGLSPHHMARHALVRSPLASTKAAELAKELGELGQTPAVHETDLVRALESRDQSKAVLPKQAGYAVNSTASLAVREALSNLRPKDVKPRLAEVALFGRGNGGFLLIEGVSHNPTLHDLVAELYATAQGQRLQTLLFDSDYGLTEVQIGQGCSSLTMPMTDMRLSAMTAALTENFVASAQAPVDDGTIVVGTTAEDSPDTSWIEQTVPPFEVVPIEGAEGWVVRICQKVLDQMREDDSRYSTVETGGVMIGLCSARLKAVTVVDLLSAPSDSERSDTKFVLGTSGLQRAIRARHDDSGQTLFDVGTWHSHLNDSGPSPRDRQTAQELARERPPPSVLLIVAPTKLYALMHPGVAE